MTTRKARARKANDSRSPSGMTTGKVRARKARQQQIPFGDDKKSEGRKARQQQVPFGDDNQKSEGKKSKGYSRSPLGMTTRKAKGNNVEGCNSTAFS
jgi:hypothetical protein